MDSRIESRLYGYKEALGKIKSGEVVSVEPLDLTVNWNTPRNGGQFESFGENLSKAIAFIKSLTMKIENETYAEKEDYPSLNFNYKVEYSDGKKGYHFDSIIDPYQARHGQFNI